MSEFRLNKYFANDGDKFVFWIENKQIRFEKISVILNNHFEYDTPKFKGNYRRLKALPELDWNAFNYSPDVQRKSPDESTEA